MRKTQIAALAIAGLVVLAAEAWANCRTHSFYQNGKYTTCTTCCYGNNCNTTCY